MSISDNTIAQLQLAVATQELTLDGETYTTRPVYALPQPAVFKEPAPDALKFRSLTALVDYIQGPFKAEGVSSFFVHVHGPASVTLEAHLSGPAEQRDRYAKAEYEEAASFKFGDFIGVEWFIIQVQAQFVDNADRKKLLALVGNIKDSKTIQTQDDGTTQNVTAKVGITRVEDAPVPNPVLLAPRRTFPEIEQPVSPFVVRLRSRDPLPECSLWEADGGAWKNEARLAIKAWLKERLPEVTILA